MGKDDQYDFEGMGSGSSGDSSNGDSAAQGSSSNTGQMLEVDLKNLPHKIRREDVKDERENISVHVQQETLRGIRETERLIQDEFEEERVSIIDVYEIVIMNGLRDSDGEFDAEGLLENARRIGYGLRQS